MSWVLQHTERATAETRNVRMHALMKGVPSRNVRMENLTDESHRESLRPFENATPVGSVEFIVAWARYWGLYLNQNFATYPDKLHAHLGRNVHIICLTDALKEHSGFIKPTRIKQFNGFCLSANDEHAQEQRICLKELDPYSLVWFSDEVHWAAEWRCYIQNKEVIGVARYDPHESDTPWTSAYHAQVVQWVAQADIVHPYAMDVGINEHGVLRLVECNDAWALGLYEGMGIPQYVGMLEERWKYVLQTHEIAPAGSTSPSL